MTTVTTGPDLLCSRVHQTSEMDQVLHTVLVGTHTHLASSTLIFSLQALGLTPVL